MKRFSLSVLIVVVFALSAFAQDAGRGTVDKNNKLSSPTGRFEVTLPSGFAPYQFTVRPTQTDAGELTINQYASDLERGTWMVAYYDLPSGLFQTKSIKQMLDDGRDGAIKGDGTLVRRDETLTVDGLEARSVVVEIPNGGKPIYARSVFVLAKPRMYNYLFLSLDEAELNKADVKTFFDSFHIIN